MKAPERFSPAEARRLAEAVLAGQEAACPRCGGGLDEWRVPPRTDVSYVRDRVWLVCASCSRMAVLDRRGPR